MPASCSPVHSFTVVNVARFAYSHWLCPERSIAEKRDVAVTPSKEKKVFLFSDACVWFRAGAGDMQALTKSASWKNSKAERCSTCSVALDMLREAFDS